MAYTFSINNVFTLGSQVYWALEQALAAAGWTKTQDSDGTVYSAVGAQVTHNGVGVNGLNNVSAWFVMQAPAVAGQQRSFSFQRGANAGAWRIKYSPAAGFIGGAPGPVQTPSAADERILAGGGTDALPTYDGTNQPNGAATIRMHITAGQGPESYNFVLWSFTNGTTTYSAFGSLILDVLLPNSTPVGDTDPAIVCISKLEGPLRTPTMWAAPANGWVQGFANSPLCWNGNGTQWQLGLPPGVDPFTGSDQLTPVFYGKMDAPPKFYKGISTLFYGGTVRRASMDTYNLIGVRDFVYVETASGANVVIAYAIPWDGSVPIL